MAQQVIRFGIIGLGLMGREFASAAARWAHLLDLPFRPEIVAICDSNPALFDWYTSNFSSIQQTTSDYQALLANPAVDAVYCAVPHHLHAAIYADIIHAGKGLLGEKPFGIDAAANAQILAAVQAESAPLVACSSEFPFYPGVKAAIDFVQAGHCGQIIEVQASFFHSSDLNPNKPLNWKRIASMNGEYGCMGDLGMHVLHVPLRMGWLPQRVTAQLSNIVTTRPDGKGATVACDTWDNAVILCDVPHPDGAFPMTLKTYRIAPGETNTWVLEVTGMSGCVRFSTRYPKSFYTLQYTAGGVQQWREESLGYASRYTAITGGIFEFGFSDALLQMWAAFCDEYVNGRAGMRQPFYCATPAEAAQHHALLTAALASHVGQASTTVGYPSVGA